MSINTKQPYYIYADKFILRNQTIRQQYLEVRDGKFGDFYQELPSKSAPVLDYSGQTIAPGLVDTHIHGFKGHDVMDGDFDGLQTISKALLSCGVTSFLPTTLTADKDKLNDVSKMIGEHYQEVEGAKIRGIFFEGPFFTEEHKGAQNPAYFTDPDPKEFDEWQHSAHGLIKKIGVAPERDGVTEFIQHLTDEGVYLALGHGSGTYDQAMHAVYAGASIFLHTYNGMSGLNHRQPGMVGAAMATDNTYSELICDGHHVHPAAVKALIKAKTPKRIILVTDCMRAGGMPEGHYVLGEFPVEVKDGAARLTSNGSLAGSVLKLVDAVRNLVNWGVVSLEDAVRMASYIPAESIGMQDQCGSIQMGQAADFIVLNRDLALQATYLNGQSVYQNDAQ